MNLGYRFGRAGFTLVEVAMVMFVVGLVLTGVLAAANSQIANGRISATKQRLDAVKEALVTFIANNNRLPCPANPALTLGNAAYGVEATTPGTCTGAVNFGAGATASARGIVPWVTLGLPDEATLDGWDRRFSYQVYRTQTNLTSATIPSLAGNIRLLNSAGGADINPGNRATVIVLSHGENGAGAYLPHTGARINPASSGVDEVENTDNDTDYVHKAYTTTAANPFDDIVLWLTPADLLTELQRTSVITTTAGSVNEKLTNAKNALIGYLVGDTVDPKTVFPAAVTRTVWRRLPYADRAPGACGGSLNNGTADNNCLTGNVPWSTLGIAQASVTDPWGNTLRYTVETTLAQSTATSGLRQSPPALGTSPALTLRSLGADGIAATADDTTLSISVGQLRGLLPASGITVDP